jgi:hypothetical protein
MLPLDHVCLFEFTAQLEFIKNLANQILAAAAPRMGTPTHPCMRSRTEPL